MKLKHSYFLCLLIILSGWACNSNQNKGAKNNLIICELNTEGIDESVEHIEFKCDTNKYSVNFYGLYSKEQSFFGDASIKLTQKYKYGTNVKIDKLKEGQFIEASIWRKDGSKSSMFILEAIDHPFYTSEKLAIEQNKEGWEKLKILFKVPAGINSIKLYSYVGNSDQSYFDGLNVKIYKETYYPNIDFSSNSKLFFSPENTRRFNEKRSTSIDLGVNINDGEWMDGILFNQFAMPIKARLKGDWLDHLTGGKWSYRIKVKDDYTFNRMKVFSIQHPKSRFYLYEYFSHLMFIEENLLTTRYGFTNGSINGLSVGLYAWEEHFTKQLIEFNLRREGPIVKFDENPLWMTVAYKKLNPINPKTNITLPYFHASRIMPFGKVEDPNLLNQFKISQKLMDQYKNRTVSFNDCFDIDKYGRYWALIDLLNGSHSKPWHNQRFYYNPVICKLEPINFDNYTDYFNPNEKGELTYLYYKKFKVDNPAHNLENSPFRDSTFLRSYLKYLKFYSSETFVNAFMNAKKDSLIKFDTILQKEFPAYSFDFDFLAKRAKHVKSQIPELEQFITDKTYKEYKLIDHNIKFKPIYVSEVVPSFLNSYLYQDSIGKTNILFENYNSIDLTLVGIVSKNKQLLYRFQDSTDLKKYYDKVQPVKIETPNLPNSSLIAFKIKGQDSTLFSQITHWEKVSGLSPYQKVKRDFNLSESNLFTIYGDSLVIKSGKHSIDQKVLIPSGKKVFIEAGSEIDITTKGSFISHSPIYALGTKSNPILVHSSDSSANGFIVLQAKQKSILSYTTFKHLNTLNYDGWVLTGAVNFYESDVDLNHCEFISNHCEDALNIVRSHFNVNQAEFYHIYADAFDSDFCTGELNNSIFKYVGNDAIDFSTSQITISDCVISDIDDKGISGGEESTLKVFNTTISNCNIGAASKDLSNVELNNVSISNCNYGLVALRKKPEYGPAILVTNQLKLDNCHKQELIELNSVLIREGKEKKGIQKNVAAMFY